MSWSPIAAFSLKSLRNAATWISFREALQEQGLSSYEAQVTRKINVSGASSSIFEIETLNLRYSCVREVGNPSILLYWRIFFGSFILSKIRGNSSHLFMLSMIVLRSTGLNQVRMSVQCIPKSFQMSSSSKNSMIGLSPLEKSYSSLFLQPSFSSFVLPPLPLPCVSLRPHKISTNPLVSPPDSRCYSKKKKGKSDSDEETNDYPAFAFDPNQLGRDMDKFVSAFADSLCKLRSSRATPGDW